MKRLGFIAMLLIVSSVALAWQYKQLSGSYQIGGKTFYDPPENEPQDTHLYVELTGQTAKDLYDQMKVAPTAGACADKGTKTKTIGEMRCTRSSSGKQHHAGSALT